MRLLLACLLLVPLWAADDPPPLTDAQRIEIREAQLRAVRAVNARLQLVSLIQEAVQEENDAQATLTKLVISLRPADCEDCKLEEDLTWKRPAPLEESK